MPLRLLRHNLVNDAFGIPSLAFFLDDGADTLSIPLIIGLFVGLAVAYYLRPLDRRIVKKE